ncbi:hypothetical protein FRACYDRAFT_233210 [Fragilariopsis cylindrus CCMP1102]|uniref:RRM domain-containing protein n=1 Tax=Fragilariopsis cylindrus CCMP1102 TaxID=635003 RepID=A0A1E7FY35_9STRA|nr:hypothetical protein FRACYDRAFT_233210 [Fragilariopsis cylindrus CCMP1102]|eukprot:OEU23044.1 hypothetical protein FRACYDRAFT_233210 [Fragilariopsis cylindrus CCMP1102]
MNNNKLVIEEEEPPKKENKKFQSVTRSSISECTFVSNFWIAHDVLGVSLKENIRLIIPPSQQKSKNKNRNNNNNNNSSNSNSNSNSNSSFHVDFKTDDLDGMVVMFQAKAKESIAVILSPYPSLPLPLPLPLDSCDNNNSTHDSTTNGNTTTITNDATTTATSTTSTSITSTASVSTYYYEIVFGSNNNTSTTIRRRRRRKMSSSSNSNSNSNSTTTKDINNDHTTKEYNESIVNIPSRVCRGFTNTNDNNKNDDDNNSDNDNECWTSYWVCLFRSKLYIGVGCSPGKECFGFMEMKEEDHQLKVPTSQDDLPIVCLSLASTVSTSVSSISATMDNENENENEVKAKNDETLELKRYMEEYRTECRLRKKRAQKYDTRYNEKPILEFLPWSKAKRLLLSSSQQQQQQQQQQRINATTGGFVTGDIDFRDPEETAKREARKARFTAVAAAANNDTIADGSNSTKNSSQNNNDKVDTVNDNNTNSSTDGLPVEQAWDKEHMLRPLRRDPPSYLWGKTSSNTDTMTTSTTITSSTVDPFSMYKDEKLTTKSAPSWITDKLHISAIDWAAFKQIRNEDINKYFESYGPIKYIEWLGDLSCNVCFDDKNSASRALICLSNELPSPPKPQPHSILSKSSSSSQQPTIVSRVIDLGCMTWRFGKYPIRKVSNDRHGRKGTIARFLIRVGTTEDILMKRPNTWPEPPGKFSSDRVLGPESDYADDNNNINKIEDDSFRKNKRRQPNKPKKNVQQDQQDNRSGSKSKRKRQRRKSDNYNNSDNSNRNRNDNKSNNNNNISTAENLLYKSLSSGSRSGFSVEEMEKERQAKKKQKKF